MTRCVGTDLPRPEGVAKVTGRARYVADLPVPGAWWGAAVRSTVVCGRLLAVELDPDFDFGQVVVVLAADVPGDNVVALIVDDQPLLADGHVSHVGEPLALVAAPSRDLLQRALEAVTVRVEPEPAILDFEHSSAVLKSIELDRGNVEAAWSGAAHVVEGVYRTDSQEQMYIEPQGCVAHPPDADGCVRVEGSLQCPYYVQQALCRALSLPPEKARVVQCETGGGFGGKEDYPSVLACHAALLAVRCGRPVKMILDRHEDLRITPKRHPSRVRHRTAVAADGTLLAMDIDVLLDGGAYTTLSPVVLSRGVIHAAGPYRCPNVRVRGRVVATNHPSYGAFRGFGVPQTCFSIERQMDRIARAVGLHPAELRRRNVLRLGDQTATGQVLDHSVGSERVLSSALQRSGFERHPWRSPKHGRRRRGLGLSLFYHGSGFTGSGEQLLKSRVEVELAADGGAVIKVAATEIGQGTNAMLLAIAADSLGADPDDVELLPPDTARVPNSGPTVASRTCMIVGACVAEACRELARRVGAGDEPFAVRARRFVAGGGDRTASVVYRSPPGLRWDEETCRGDAYPTYGWAADAVEVEVDMDTFAVEVKRFWTAVDIGKAIQPLLVEGQIEGGSLQALGFAHLEAVTSVDGRLQQDRMATCIVPTSVDAPDMDVELVEEPFRHGPFGAKGVGELPMDGGAPAVLSAIEDALGMHLDRAPATPERLLEAWLREHPEEALEP